MGLIQFYLKRKKTCHFKMLTFQGAYARMIISVVLLSVKATNQYFAEDFHVHSWRLLELHVAFPIPIISQIHWDKIVFLRARI